MEVIGATFAIHNGYVYVFYRDYLGSGYEDQFNWVVAKVSITDLIRYAIAGEVVKFKKILQRVIH